MIGKPWLASLHAARVSLTESFRRPWTSYLGLDEIAYTFWGWFVPRPAGILRGIRVR